MVKENTLFSSISSKNIAVKIGIGNQQKIK